MIPYILNQNLSRLEELSALLPMQGSNTRTESPTFQAEIVQAEPATLKMIPAYIIVPRRPSTGIDSYGHVQSIPERQIVRHDQLVPGAEVVGVRTPPTRSPRLAPTSVAPQIPILAFSTSPLNHTSLSEDIKKAFQDISEEGQTAQNDVIGCASTSQLPLVKGPSLPTVPWLHESGASMRRKLNDTLQNSPPKESRYNRFVWDRFSPSREPLERSRRYYWRESSVTRLEDIGSAPDVQVPAPDSESSDISSATTLNTEDTSQAQELHSLLLQSQVAETALVER